MPGDSPGRSVRKAGRLPKSTDVPQGYIPTPLVPEAARRERETPRRLPTCGRTGEQSQAELLTLGIAFAGGRRDAHGPKQTSVKRKAHA